MGHGPRTRMGSVGDEEDSDGFFSRIKSTAKKAFTGSSDSGESFTRSAKRTGKAAAEGGRRAADFVDRHVEFFPEDDREEPGMMFGAQEDDEPMDLGFGPPPEDEDDFLF